MLEAMAEIGRVLVKEANELENLLKSIPQEKGGKKQYLGKIDFNTSGKIRLELEEIDTYETPRKYLWVGHVRGYGHQYFATVQTLEYIVAQVVPNLLKALDPNTRLWQELEIVREVFYRRMPGGEIVLDVESPGLDALPGTLDQLYEDEEAGKKGISARVATIIKEKFKEMLEPKAEIGLWTLLINGIPVARYSEYRDFVLYKKMEEGLSGSQEGWCSVCGSKAPVSVEAFKGLSFKYYILDKIGFASEINKKGFFHNYTLCANCYRGLLMAENFVTSKLGTRLGNFKIYIVPAFLFPLAPSRDELERWAEYVSHSVKTANNFTRLEKMEEELETFLEMNELDNKILLNLLFYQRNQSELRVLRLIKDVAPSRLKKLVSEMRQVGRVGNKLLGESKYWMLDFNGLYYLIPLRTGGAEEFKKMLEIYDSLISGWPLGYDFLITQFVGLIQIYTFQRFSNTNIKDPGEKYRELSLAQAVLKANLFFYLLRKLELLEGGISLAEFPEKLHIQEEMKTFLREMKYSEPQAALFLLGYLTNQVGRKQYEQGHESKPVLAKINYEGMRFPKLIHFSNMVFNLLRQYKALSFNEVYFSEMKRLLDRYAGRWPLSPEENVFYLLSGYAYGVQRAVTAKVNQDKKANQDKNGGEQ